MMRNPTPHTPLLGICCHMETIDGSLKVYSENLNVLEVLVLLTHVVLKDLVFFM